MKLLFVLLAALLLFDKPEDRIQFCDSLDVLMEQRTGVRAKLKIKKILKRKGKADIYFSKDLGSYRWTHKDIAWFKNTLEEQLDSKGSIGRIFSGPYSLEELITPGLPYSGQASGFAYRTKQAATKPFISKIGEQIPTKGLYGRHIAIWQSHGRYFEESESRWKWQRPALHRTVEDLYTQSYVLQLLIPMLENAGAVAMTPRERDFQKDEVVVDMDPSFRDTLSITPDKLLRRKGEYKENGVWSNAGVGFADAKKVYSGHDNPFTMGTSRKAACKAGQKESANAVWSASFDRKGRYSVYVSYPDLPNSSRCALYSVNHLGGCSEFVVDQKVASGTWVYLGSFDFEGECSVVLSNATPSGHRFTPGSVVGADAVRFGGGMGKIGRGCDTLVSGLPSYAEGAMYNMQWSGIPDTIWDNWDGDYIDDYDSRGRWVEAMKKRGVPFDLSLAFHSDAGMAGRDSTIGTLAIYSSTNEGSRKFSNGESRQVGRSLADIILSQIVSDVRAQFCPDWRRRELRDSRYSEARKSDVPALLLELLSHQNFADMRFGHNPEFKFCASRAVYKGILKFLSLRYGKDFVVQPLPVKDFRTEFNPDGTLGLSWSATPDSLEPTAKAESYILYTKIDDGSFDKGVRITGTETSVKLNPGRLYSFKIEAWNQGGRSFPSEILSAGISNDFANGKFVTVVNNFTELREPAGFSDEWFAGFNAKEDSGIPFGDDYTYVGENYNLHRASMWMTDDEPGFGATSCDYGVEKVAGNTFDYTSIHGKAILKSGRSFCSSSAGAFCKKGSKGKLIDLICGKQKNVWTEELRKAIANCNAPVLVSGAHIATDANSKDPSFCIKFLGINPVSGHAGTAGCAGKAYEYHTRPNPDCYCVESSDAFTPTGISGSIVLKYTDNFLPAAVYTRSGKDFRKLALYGFPLETLKNTDTLNSEIKSALDYLDYE